MRKIVKYEFSAEDRKILNEISDAVSEICREADDDCYWHEEPCPFQCRCAFFSDNDCEALADVIENLPNIFNRISLP